MLHGISPSAARKQGTSLKAFPRISFNIIIKGDVEVNYRIEKKDSFKIVGVNFNPRFFTYKLKNIVDSIIILVYYVINTPIQPEVK